METVGNFGDSRRWRDRARPVRRLRALVLCLAMVFLAGMAAGWHGSAFPAAGLAEPVASRVSIEQDGDATVMTAHLTYAIPFNVYVLPDPYRVMIDMPGVDFRLRGRVENRSGGMIRAVRYGRLARGRARMVLEVEGPVLIRRSYVLHPQKGNPAKLVVELVRTDEDTFRALLAAMDGKEESGKVAADDVKPLRSGDPVPEDLPIITRAYRRLVEMAALDDAGGAPSSIEELIENDPLKFDPEGSARPVGGRGDGRKGNAERSGRSPDRAAAAAREKGTAPAPSGGLPLIVIDPGHGGKDPGALGRRGRKEKDLVLLFARELAKTLRATGRYRVRLTRSGDSFLTLRERVRFARRNGAALFISIHADKFRLHSAHGAAIYTLSERASDQEAAELARKENAADLVGGVDLGEDSDEIRGILIDLTMRETKNHSIWLARNLASELRRVTKVRPRPVRSADFRVLRNPEVPAVLVELGYVSNDRDVRNMLSSAWRKRTAKAMAKAVERYFVRRLAMGR